MSKYYSLKHSILRATGAGTWRNITAVRKYCRVMVKENDRLTIELSECREILNEAGKITSFWQLLKCWWKEFGREIEVIGNIYDNPELMED